MDNSIEDSRAVCEIMPRHRLAILVPMALWAFGCGSPQPSGDERIDQTSQALSSLSAASWVAQGPAPMRNGQASTQPLSSQNPVAGAVQALAPNPSDANVIFAATVNGGVWKTSNALATNPTWTPLTDFQASLAIGAIALDRNNSQVVAAGTGCFSSFGDCGLEPPGVLLISRNGGTTWSTLTDPTFATSTISGVVIRGSIIVIANGDLVRSTDGGATFTRLTGFPATGLPFTGGVVNLVEDRQNPNRLYLSQRAAGVYRSDDLGASWVNISQNSPALDDAVRNNAGLAKMSVCQDGRAYAGVLGNDGTVNFVGYTRDGGNSWITMDLPGIRGDGLPFNHFAIAGDVSNSSFVYVTGIDNPMRGDAGIAATGQVPSPQWSPLAGGGTPNHTAPHGDSRAMVFDANLDLIEADDGGIFKRVRPRENTGDWFSLAGNMQDAEIHDIAFDDNAQVLIGGTQDNGTVYQLTPGLVPWTTFSGGDGGDVQVDTKSTPGFSIRYSSFQFFEGFTRATFNANNVLVSSVSPALTVISGPPPTFGRNEFVTPLELNRANPQRLVFAAFQAVYESFDQGDTVASLGAGGEANAMAYGHPNNPDVLYVAQGNVLVRLTAGAPLVPTPTPIPFPPQDVVMDSSDFHKLYAAGAFHVFDTPDAGNTWNEITGNLTTLNPGILRTIEFVPASTQQFVVVGADHGVFATSTRTLGTWQKIGTNLPLAPVNDMQYSTSRDLLVTGLLGRGAWSVQGLGTL